MENETTPKRGGARKGAGRRAASGESGAHVRIGPFTVPEDLGDLLRSLPKGTASAYVVAALRAYKP